MQGLLEDSSLRTKTGGQTYLEWLHRAPPPPQSHGIEPLGLPQLRQLYKTTPEYRTFLLRTARSFKYRGRRALFQCCSLPTGVSWEALEQALRGIIDQGLV